VITELLRVVAVVGCGLVAGLLFVFSAGVMTGLARLPGDGGAEAMRAINAAVLNPLFLAVFAGSGLTCVALVVAVVVTGGPVAAAAGAVLHLAGAIGVTAAVNVQMNDALQARTLDWARYRRRWTAWNHVRTAAAVAATALLAVSG
jgi:uncharacterized membrane protein